MQDPDVEMTLSSGVKLELALMEMPDRQPDGGLSLSPVPAREFGYISLSVFGFEATAPLTKAEIRELIDHLDELQGKIDDGE